MKNISVAEIRNHLADAINRVAYQGERIVLERRGKGVAAIVSLEDLERLETLEDERDVREARKVLAEMRRKGQRPVPLAEVKKKLGL